MFSFSIIHVASAAVAESRIDCLTTAFQLQCHALFEDCHIVEARFLAADFFCRTPRRSHSRTICCPTVSNSASSTSTPALKSIQFFFFPANVLLLEIFTVGTGDANGVPRPVVNSTICAPLAASAVAATRSLPGADKDLIRSLYALSVRKHAAHRCASGLLCTAQ